MYRQLEQAAKVSGRTIFQELVFRAEQSLSRRRDKRGT
jgi:hypothetical protein